MLAHGIEFNWQLLTSSIKKNTAQPQSCGFDWESEDVTDDTDLSDTSDDDEDGVDEFVTTSYTNYPTLNTNYKTVIDKVRAMVKIFKNSPVKNVFAKTWMAGYGQGTPATRRLQNSLGKHRYNGERFNLIKSSVTKALIDMKSPIEFSQNDLDTLDGIQKCLNIVKLTVEALCRRDATLLTADVAMKCLLRKLDSQNSALANELAPSLRIRISQRSLLLASILQYLQNPESYFAEVSSDVFPKINNREMVAEMYTLTKLTNNFQQDSPVMKVWKARKLV